MHLEGRRRWSTRKLVLHGSDELHVDFVDAPEADMCFGVSLLLLSYVALGHVSILSQ
jgi:hypothetical protein